MLELLSFRSLILSIAIVIACVSKVHAELDQPLQKIVAATVTDRDDKPIEGAKVVALRWLDEGDADAPVVLTNAEGEFEFAINERKNTEESHLSNYVIIHKEGYAVGALNLARIIHQVRCRVWIGSRFFREHDDVGFSLPASWRTTAPSPNSFFFAMDEINSEALRSGARDPAAA